jgi:hypothetical protein
MTADDVLTLFAGRGPRGVLQLTTRSGFVVVRSTSWRGVRLELERLLARSAERREVTVLVGRPQGALSPTPDGNRFG